MGILFHQQNGGSLLLVNALDDVENFPDQQGSQAQRGFVQEHEAGAGHQCAADGQHLLFTTGEVPGDLMSAFFQAGEVVVDHLQVPTDVVTVAPGVGPHQEVLFHRQVLEDATPFHDLEDALADDFFRIAVLNGLAVVQDGAIGDFAPLGLKQARDGLQGGGLPRAIGPQQGHDLPLMHFQGEALEDQDDLVVDDLDIVQLK